MSLSEPLSLKHPLGIFVAPPFILYLVELLLPLE